MADKTAIEWTDATWNPIAGCSVVSAACTNCYAMKMAARLERMGNLRYAGMTQPSKSGPVWTGKIVHAPDYALHMPLRWKKPRRIFVNSMSDLFHEAVEDWKIVEIYGLMIAAHHLRGHTFQWLTKRSARARKILNDAGFWDEVNDVAGQEIIDRCDPLNRRQGDARATCDDYSAKNPPPAIWAGVTAEDQTRADERIPDLLATPAAVRFVSAEPLLSGIDFSPWLEHNPVYEKQAKRRVCLPSGSERRFGNPAGRDDLAHPQKGMGPLAEESSQSLMQTGEGGARLWGVSASPDHDGRREDLRAGAPTSLPPLQGPDSSRFDDQPQGRKEEAQPSRQSGISDLFGAADPRNVRLKSGSRLQSARRKEFDGDSVNRAGSGDTAQESVGGESGSNRGRLRDSVSNRIEDRQGRPTLDLIIAGGESGPNARPSHPDWFRSLASQCQKANVPFFFKQWGEWETAIDRDKDDPDWRKDYSSAFSDGGKTKWLNLAGGRGFHGDRFHVMRRVGKRRAGSLLDGVEHKEFPQEANNGDEDSPDDATDTIEDGGE